jgi:hypothetical protein
MLSFVFILISFFVQKNMNLTDVEFNGHIIVKARYYEYWSTWVQQTCSYTTTCCCDSKGSNCQTETHYYDCSYCDQNPAHWEAIDDNGNKFTISEEKYNLLKRQWSSTPQFVDLNRNIDQSGSCGVDGDMFEIRWDGKIETAEASVTTHEFTNKLKVSHSAFNFPIIKPEIAKSQGLYDYPGFYDDYKQRAVLGLDSFNIQGRDTIQRMFEFFNGYMGPRFKVKVFTLLYRNKPIDIAFKQEQYWQGGNQNEFVVCIGLNDTLGVDWVKPFTWCDNKRVSVDTREDIAELGHFDRNAIYNIYNTNIRQYFHYKSFKDFNYLKFEPTTGQLLFVYICTFVISLISLYIVISNEFTRDMSTFGRGIHNKYRY